MFFLHCYDPNINYRKEKSKVQFISSRAYHQLQAKFEQDVKKNIEAVSFVETAEYCRGMLGVVELLRQVIFIANNDNNISSQRQILSLQEYGKVKNVLFASSVKHGSQRFIFPMILKFILKELKVNSRIRLILKQSYKTSVRKSTVMAEDKEYFRDSSKDYLRQFLQISLGDVNEAIKLTHNDEISLESIKETFELVLFENSKEGKKIAAKLNHKTPFRRKTTLMSRSGSKWNLSHKEEEDSLSD
mmetsp:Transcript_19890/g.19515  ORF Transcript_19890/g.19515 Transcript_19890/m.19515 type:complete len:245 (-) Transcript_19890:17-751(-)